MRGRTAAQRREDKINRSVVAVRSKMSYRDAQRKFLIPKSTIWDRAHAKKKETTSRNALTSAEEKVIVDLILLYADRGVPLHRRHMQGAAEIVISKMTPERQSQLPFTNGRPGEWWARKL